MGVLGLQSFVKDWNHVPGGSRKVDIVEEIAQWKIEHNNQCTLVFDLMGLVQTMRSDALGAICGYRYWLSIKRLNDFFQRLRDLGARIMFFDDGPPVPAKFDKWNLRQTNKYLSILKFHDKLDQNQTLTEIFDSSKFDIGSFTMPEIEPLMDVCQRHGQIETCYDLECDLVLAKYATEQNAMAVIAEDSDFLIFPGSWKYWSSGSLDILKMQTDELSRTRLTQALQLDQGHMALFATLSGNDIMQWPKVEAFVKSLGGRYTDRFYMVAKYIRDKSFPIDLLNPAHANQLVQFATDTNLDQSLLRNSLKSYDLTIEHTKPSEKPLFRAAWGRRAVYHIMLKIPRTFSLHFCDLRSGKVLPLQTLWLPLYERQIGVVLRDNPNKETSRRILTRLSTKDRESFHHEVFAKFPKDNTYPSLDEMLDDDQRDIQPLIRYQLVAWMMTGNEYEVDDPLVKRIAEIDTGYRVVLLTLRYLFKIGQLSKSEADTILRVEVGVRHNTIKEDLECPTHIKSHNLNMVRLYARMHETVRNCLIICGIPIDSETLTIDSAYYHILREHPQRFNEIELEGLNDKVTRLRSFYTDE